MAHILNPINIDNNQNYIPINKKENDKTENKREEIEINHEIIQAPSEHNSSIKYYNTFEFNKAYIDEERYTKIILEGQICEKEKYYFNVFDEISKKKGIKRNQRKKR